MRRLDETGQLYQTPLQQSFQIQQQNEDLSDNLSQQMLDQSFLMDQSQEQELFQLLSDPAESQQVDNLNAEGFDYQLERPEMQATPIFTAQGIKGSELILKDKDLPETEELMKNEQQLFRDANAPEASAALQKAAPAQQAAAELPSFQNLLNLSRDFLSTDGDSTLFTVLKTALENLETVLRDAESDERTRAAALNAVRQAAAAYVSAHDGSILWSSSGRKRRRLAKSILSAATEAATSTEASADL